MLCYKDKTWCSAQDCANKECTRNMNGSDFCPDEFWEDKICCAPLYKDCEEYEQDESKCKRCGQRLDSEDNHFNLGCLENICEDCVYSLISSEDNKAERNQATDERGEAYAKCHWCEELYSISEMREEKDMGYLCDRCIHGILSHGEQLTIVHGG